MAVGELSQCNDVLWLTLYTVYPVQCTICILAFIMHRVHCTVYIVQCSVQCTVYSVKSTVYSVQCTVYSVQCTVSLQSGHVGETKDWRP